MKQLAKVLLCSLPGAVGYASVAEAVHLNPNGTGQALLYPYYGVNGGNQTIVTIVNTANDIKAVRVRFMESRNSREVLDFNLYLSPFDVWTGALFALDANGAANLVTLDNSCTVPEIRTNASLSVVGVDRYVPFRNTQYTGERNDGGGQTVARTREGHLEVIEMGTLLAGMEAPRLGDEATQAASGIPANCAALVAAWSGGGAWTAGGAATGTNAPTGGLYGSGAVVDVANGTMLAYGADAIDGFFFTGNAADDLHFAPASGSPTLNNARTGSLSPPVTSFAFQGGTTPSVVTSSWNRSAPNDLAGVDAVSATLMVDAIYNEYTLDPGLGAATEWVVTFPTKRFYVDDVAFGGLSSLPVANATFRFALPPFAGVAFTGIVSGARVGSFACEDLSISVFDRESALARPFSGGQGNQIPQLCEATNIVTFDQIGPESTILGTPSVRYDNIDVPFHDGSARLRFPTSADTGHDPGFIARHMATSADGDAYAGLPVTGFQAVTVINAGANPGVLANYAGAFRHRGTTRITPAGPN